MREPSATMVLENMSQSSKPDINSWLEDELYQQYRHDRKTVDPTWERIFEEDGLGTLAGNGAPGDRKSARRFFDQTPKGDQFVAGCFLAAALALRVSILACPAAAGLPPLASGLISAVFALSPIGCFTMPWGLALALF